MGKIFLANLSQAELEAWLANNEMKAYTSKTITGRKLLLEELEEVRRTQISYDDGEYNDEVRCVAVAVRDFTGATVAGIGVSGPVWHMSIQFLNRVARELQEAAKSLASELGG